MQGSSPPSLHPSLPSILSLPSLARGFGEEEADLDPVRLWPKGYQDPQGGLEVRSECRSTFLAGFDEEEREQKLIL